MFLQKITLLGIDITVNPREQILEFIKKYLHISTNQKPLTIVTPNPEQVVYAKKDERFRQILNQADIALPDGIGIVWAHLILGVRGKGKEEREHITSHISRITGIEFMEDLIKLAAEESYGIALVGGRNGVAEQAFVKLQQRFPKLVGWGENGPEVGIRYQESGNKKETSSNTLYLIHATSSLNEYLDELWQKIIKTKTRLLFIGLGAPKQEYIIEEFHHYLTLHPLPFTLVLMSVGGAFDEISGKLPRSPDVFNKLGFKWLWRLLLEPQRIFRQSKLVKFIWLVLREYTRDFKRS